jgi:hypothetical protein
MAFAAAFWWEPPGRQTLLSSQLDICNLALAHLPAAPIASVSEDSLEARECRRFYPHVISDMLEGPHDWSFANRRVALAQLTNDRDKEWLYAYALPSNLGSPIRVIPDLTAAGFAVPIPLPGEPYAETWATSGGYIETPYIIDGSTLYSNTQGASLEFTVNDVAGINISQLALRAISLDLAARLAIPIKKDSERETKLLQAAELAWQRAIADDRNRQPENQDQYISESMAARRGYLTESS